MVRDPKTNSNQWTDRTKSEGIPCRWYTPAPPPVAREVPRATHPVTSRGAARHVHAISSTGEVGRCRRRGGPPDCAGRARAVRDYPERMDVTRERRLAEAFVGTADTVVGDFDVIEFLRTLAERCVQLLDVDAAGLMLADRHGKMQASPASAEDPRLMELFELQADGGPCLDTYRTGRPVLNANLHASRARWPRFAEAAMRTGYVSVHALPLRLRATVIGALNLFSSQPGRLSDQDARTGQALADAAAVGILAQRSIHRHDLQTNQLQNALNSRVVIEQAKGLLAERHQIGVETAFALLREYARSHRLHLSDLARDVIEECPTKFPNEGFAAQARTDWFIAHALALRDLEA